MSPTGRPEVETPSAQGENRDISLRVLIIGATSAIATALARRHAQRGSRLFLVGRRESALASAAADLTVRGADEVSFAAVDFGDVAAYASIVEVAWRRWDGVDRVLVAHGMLPDQQRCENDVNEALVSFDINARSVVAWATHLATRLETQGSGALAVISSPAGDRGRASNYVYGCAKAAVTNLMSGLQHRLARRGVRVLNILPGFVDTPMTAGFKKGPLWASPERVAADIDAALERRSGVVYTPWFWRWIMLLIIHLPQRVFLRTKL